MLAPNKNQAALLNKNTELAVRLKVSEAQNQLLREEIQRLKTLEQSHEQLKKELAQKTERTVLLEEELKWLRAQYYGRSTHHSDAAEENPDQRMLFNEAEVLAAIEAADAAHAARTTTVEAHARKRSPDSGRKAIPEHFPRIVIEHDLPAEQKMCTKCAEPQSLDAHGRRDARVLPVRCAQDQRRAARAPDVCVRGTSRGADHRACPAGDLAEVDGEFLAAGARDQIQVRPRV